MGIGAAIASGVAAITGAIGGAVATGAALVVGAETAATIGAIAGPAIFGAGVGAVGSAITGGNPLIGALTGGLTGGLAGAGAGGAIGGALGIGEGAGNALVGAGVGALGSGLSGQNPLMGALTGAAGGFLSGGGLNDLAGAGSAFGGSSGGYFGDATGGGYAGSAEGATSGALNQAANAATPTLDMADNSDLNPQSRFTGASTSQAVGDKGESSWLKRQWDAAVNGNDPNPITNPTGKGALINADGSIVTPPIPPDQATFTYGDGTTVPSAAAMQQAMEASPGYVNTPAGQSAASSDSGGVLNWLGKHSNLALGALSGISSLFSKPTQPTYANVPTAANNTAWNSQPLNFAPLNPNFAGRQATTPNVNYYTYGQIPGGARFFNNNSLRAYGFAKGGALNAAANDDQYETSEYGSNRVRGPGGPTDDRIEALLSNGEYVLTAKEVKDISGKSNDAGARKLDRMRSTGALSQVLRRAQSS